MNPKWKGIKMGRYFGTDGFRGEANKNLTVEHATAEEDVLLLAVK